MNTRRVTAIVLPVLCLLVCLSIQVRAQTDTSKSASGAPDFDTPPRVTIQAPATYPPQALKDGTEGTVYVQAVITEKGRVQSTTVLKTEAEVLNDAACAAVKNWRFTPATKDGKNVAATVTIPFKFKLNKDGSK
ncbi:MAG: energy transducer TonB [Ignavibacteriae bacterium]|nr:energy transducer TonB [Ignavibacteriota bacterium]